GKGTKRELGLLGEQAIKVLLGNWGKYLPSELSCCILPPACRHVMLPKDIAKLVPKTHLMSESEWRNLGVQQSQGWVHYMIHEPEPHILLFRRPLPKKPEK
ncbi:cyclin-dependent kinases regulatory subunit 1, partial [Chelonoidis abingdonii]|uniref:cyclin-dependent kinases regulatory subunit 1 n=1 Tax=Chelonoidis abingdonii TaxID=106734 RepID=UPI003F493C09